jgi:hypothetical protein
LFQNVTNNIPFVYDDIEKNYGEIYRDIGSNIPFSYEDEDEYKSIRNHIYHDITSKNSSINDILHMIDA